MSIKLLLFTDSSCSVSNITIQFAQHSCSFWAPSSFRVWYRHPASSTETSCPSTHGICPLALAVLHEHTISHAPGTGTHRNLPFTTKDFSPTAESLKNADQRGDAQTDTVQSHHPPFYPLLFPKALRPLPLTEVVWPLNSFAARLMCVAKKQSCPDHVALGPACPETPISQQDGGSKQSLECSTSLNYPILQERRLTWKGMPPSSLQGSVQIAQSLFFLTAAFSYPKQQCGSAEPPAHAIPPVGTIRFPSCREPCFDIASRGRPACLQIQQPSLCFSNSPPKYSLALVSDLSSFPVLWELWGSESHRRAAKPCPWGSAPTARCSLHQLWSHSDRQTLLTAPILLSIPVRGFISLSILPQKDSKLCTLSCLCQAPGLEPREL